MSVALVVLVLASSCGGTADEPPGAVQPQATTERPEVTEPATPSEPAEEPEAPTEGPAEEPGEEPVGDGVGSATLTIGDETWTFDKVDFCALPPVEPKDSSFVLIGKLGDWQLIAEIHDDTGAQRLEGEGVYDTIDHQNLADGTLGLWSASSQASGQQFLVVEGLSVTASATFDDLRTTEIEETPGTLDATCP
ncbi:MAG: hypothetical protein ACE5MI_05455 [Acidimicrobiia bacterium]